jgi:large subunit ribosomal protein L6
MSRIGKSPINIPSGVSVTVKDSVVAVKGPKGDLHQIVGGGIQVKIEKEVISLTRPSDDKKIKSMHGLYRSLIHNMVVGVSEGFKKELELVGVGYRAQANGQVLELSLGFSHPIHILLPVEISVQAKTDRKSNPMIFLESADKQLLGQVCAKIRSLRKPEPYKGKGVRFKGELIRRKAGKSAKV